MLPAYKTTVILFIKLINILYAEADLATSLKHCYQPTTYPKLQQFAQRSEEDNQKKPMETADLSVHCRAPIV